MVTVNVTIRIRLYMYSVFGNGGFSGGLFVEIHFFLFRNLNTSIHGNNQVRF